MPNHSYDGNAPSRPTPRRPAFSLNTPVQNRDRNNQPSRQFAPAPRFLLPQDGTPSPSSGSRDGVERFRQRAVASPFDRATTPRPVATPTPRRSNDLSIAEDEIEEDEHVGNAIGRPRGETSPCDDVFAPPDPYKKRRTSPCDAYHNAGTEDLLPAQAQSQDTISSFSSHSPPSPEQGRVRYTLASPFPRRASVTQRPAADTPAPSSRRKFVLEPKTPRFDAKYEEVNTNIETPKFRNPARYIVSANYTPPAAHEPPTPQAGGSSADTRATAKRPAFVLLRSPSPPNADNTTSGSPPPAPFSPTSTHSLGRRGQSKSTTASYVPGGMAEQVRNWILEIGMKREQQLQSMPRRNVLDPGRYSFTALVDGCRNGYLTSSGPVIMVYATQLPMDPNQQDHTLQNTLQRNLLLLGHPVSRREMQPDTATSPVGLKKGDVVGIYSGLTWEIELHDDATNTEEEEKVIASSQSPPSEEVEDDDDVMRSDSTVHRVRRWQVAAEWEVLKQS